MMSIYSLMVFIIPHKIKQSISPMDYAYHQLIYVYYVCVRILLHTSFFPMVLHGSNIFIYVLWMFSFVSLLNVFCLLFQFYLWMLEWFYLWFSWTLYNYVSIKQFSGWVIILLYFGLLLSLGLVRGLVPDTEMCLRLPVSGDKIWYQPHSSCK